MLKVRIFRAFIKLNAWFSWRGKKPTNLTIRDTSFSSDGHDIGLRIYTPEGSSDGESARVILYFHGGGFVLGSLDNQDATCRQLCVQSGSTVVSVDYRLAPEHAFPAAADDAIAAFQWLLQHTGELGADAMRIYVAGDSAGGNLAAVIAQQAKSFAPEAIRGQILIYPVTHHFSYGTASYDECAKGFLLTRGMMEWFWDLYYRNSSAAIGDDLSHPLATPLTTSDLSGLPPAIVTIAELDPLRDEGVEYAEKMAAQGVDVQLTRYAGAQHGFVGTGGPGEDNDNAIAEICTWMQTVENRAAG